MPPKGYAKFLLPGRHPIVVTYRGMMRRCYDKTYKDYAYYGGRGIVVAEAWHDLNCFIRDMAPSFFEGATLDRVDNEKSYSKENCCWATRITQANNRRSNRLIAHPQTGEQHNLESWARLLNINSKIVMQRYHKLGIRHFSMLFYANTLPRGASATPETFVREMGLDPDNDRISDE